jgi:hypothetical protein
MGRHEAALVGRLRRGFGRNRARGWNRLEQRKGMGLSDSGSGWVNGSGPAR